MNYADIVTHDLADMPNGIAFVTFSHANHGTDYPISGDILAQMRARQGGKA